MTKPKPDALLQVPPFTARPHFACRLRKDLADLMRAECKRLNCSQGVWLEIAIQKALHFQLVQQHDAYQYCHDERWFHRVLADAANGIALEPLLNQAVQSKIAKRLLGTTPE